MHFDCVFVLCCRTACCIGLCFVVYYMYVLLCDVCYVVFVVFVIVLLVVFILFCDLSLPVITRMVCPVVVFVLRVAHATCVYSVCFCLCSCFVFGMACFSLRCVMCCWFEFVLCVCYFPWFCIAPPPCCVRCLVCVIVCHPLCVLHLWRPPHVACLRLLFV